MIYDYSVYYRQNCVVPIFICLFFLGMLILSIVSLVKDLRSHTKERINSIFSAVIVVGIALYLFIESAIPLARGGIYLLFEKESDSVQVSGQVEETIEIAFYGGGKYGSTENNHGWGEAIIVNGKKYYMTSYYDIKEGDYVVLDVLPRSRLVMKMQRSTQDG